MREIDLTEAALHDLKRVIEFAEAHQSGVGQKRLMAILRSKGVLLSSPFIGRTSGGGKRQLIIGRGATGFVALYRLDDDANRVVVLRIRGQREAGYDSDEDL